MDPYIGEIRIFSGNFPPVGYHFCNGQLLAISQNEALFSLIGTTYGGDGQNTFALPDLRGRIPVHQGSSAYGSFTMGQQGGAEQRTMIGNQIPAHSHYLMASTSAATTSAAANTVFPAATNGNLLYNDAPGSTVPMHPNAITPTGGSMPITLMMPYLAINFIIAYNGIYPSRN